MIANLLYPFAALGSWFITILAMLFLNWIVVLFVDDAGNLPSCLKYFQTFDAPLPRGYWAGVMWLMRNPCYGFDLYLLGLAWYSDRWTVRTYWNDSTGTLFFATAAGGGFNFYYLGKWGMYKFGWKAWNCFNSETGKFSGTFGDGSHIPVCFSINPFKHS